MMMNNNGILLTNTEPREGTREKVTLVSRKHPLYFLGIRKRGRDGAGDRIKTSNNK